MRTRIVFFLLTAFISIPSVVFSQPNRGGVELSLPILAEQNDATSVAVNPAQVGLMRGWNLAFAYAESEEGLSEGRGAGVFFASPIAFGLSLGVGIEWTQPQEADGKTLPWRSPITLVTSWQHGHRFSLGVATRWIACSGDLGLNGLFAVDLGLTLRLSPYFAIALTGHGLNNPQARTTNLSDIQRFGREWSVGIVARPLFRDYLSLAAETTYAEERNRIMLRGIIAVRPVPGWRLKAEVGSWFDEDENGLDLSFATELAFSLFTVGGGARLAGVEDGTLGFGAFMINASIGDDGHGVLWERRRVVQLVLSSNLTTRSLAHVEETLLRAARDPSVYGILHAAAAFNGKRLQLHS